MCTLVAWIFYACSEDQITVLEAQDPFAPVATLGSGASVSVEWGDYDGDGDPDLAIGNRGQNFLYTNDGNFAFTEAPAFGAGRRSVVQWCDTDGDDDLDLLVGNDGQNQLFVNQGGVFSELPVLGTGRTLSLSCGDLDGDLNTDVVVHNDTGGSSIYRNDGGNTFAFDTTLAEQGFSVVADVDGDGAMDIITGGDTGKVFKNDGSGRFTEFSTFGASVDKSVLALADYDGDLDLDLVHGVEDGGGDNLPPLWLYENDGNGNYSQKDALALATIFSTPRWGDLDGDGDPDLVMVSLGLLDDRLVVYMNEGGSFKKLVVEQGEASGQLPVERAVSGVALGDADGDGDLDIVVARTRWVSEFVFEPGENTLFANRLTR